MPPYGARIGVLTPAPAFYCHLYSWGRMKIPRRVYFAVRPLLAVTVGGGRHIKHRFDDDATPHHTFDISQVECLGYDIP